MERPDLHDLDMSWGHEPDADAAASERGRSPSAAPHRAFDQQQGGAGGRSDALRTGTVRGPVHGWENGLSACFTFQAPELLNDVTQRGIALAYLFRGFCQQQCVVVAFLFGQYIYVAKHRLGTVWTEGERLAKGEVRFTSDAVLFLRLLGLVEPPGIQPADGAPEFGVSLAG